MTESNTIVPERKHPLDNRIPPPLLVILIALAMAGTAWLTPRIEISGYWHYAVGGTAIALGLFVVVQGARTFLRNKTTINPMDLGSTSALVTSGVFRYSRNPMYVGLAVMLVGWAVCLAAPWTIIGPIVFILFMSRFQIVPEERMMRAKFGEAYDQYTTQVRRWI